MRLAIYAIGRDFVARLPGSKPGGLVGSLQLIEKIGRGERI